MATRIKTIEYALPMITTNVATGTTYTDSSDMTIYIPETSSRTFTSVTLEVSFHDVMTTAVNLSGYSIRGSCNSGTNWTTVTSSTAIAQTGETIPTFLVTDLTSEFTSRFGSGTSGTFRWGFYVNYASATYVTNVSAKLVITYTFDDTGASTRIKTVKIPIESFNGRLSSTAQAVKQTSTASNQIPQLTGTGGFLPESGITIRQMFMELWTNTLPSTTTNAALVLKIDSGGTETTFGTCAFGLQTPYNLRILYDVSSMSTTSAHELYARHSAASGNYFTNLGGVLVVTYEYSASSTTVLNSVTLAAGPYNAPLLVSSYGAQELEAELYIQENNISLKNSGVFVNLFIGVNNMTISVKAGSQSAFTNYASTSGTGQSGTVMITQRADSGAHGGTGFSISRGKNVFSVNTYASTSNAVGAYSALFIINYTSDVPSDPDANNHTIRHIFNESETSFNTNALIDVVNSKIAIGFFATNNHFISCFGLMIFLNGFSTTVYSLDCSVRKAGLDSNQKNLWFPIVSVTTPAGNERSWSYLFSNDTDLFERYRYYPSQNLRLVTHQNRYFKWYSNTNTKVGLCWLVTFHQNTYTVTGTLSNYSGDGSGVTVNFYRVSDKELLGSTTSNVGGSFSWTWYDDTEEIFAEARESSTTLGRSDNGIP